MFESTGLIISGTGSRAALVLLAVIWGGFIIAVLRSGSYMMTGFRSIQAASRMKEAIARTAESGSHIVFIPGTAEIGNPQTMAAMTFFARIALLAAEYRTGMTIMFCRPGAYIAAVSYVGAVMQGTTLAQTYASIRFSAADPASLAASASGRMLRKRGNLNLLVGSFGEEAFLLGGVGRMSHAVQIAGTSSPSELPFLAVTSDGLIPGEELFTAGDLVSEDPRRLAGIKMFDGFRYIIIAAILAGSLLLTLRAVVSIAWLEQLFDAAAGVLQ